MDINELKIIKAVADTGSFSGAAQELNYVQSHISTRVSHLEQEIGTPIFVRHNRGVSLTPKGELFLKYANDMARIMAEANQLIAEDDTPKGNLTIAAMQTTAETVLPKLLSRYHKAWPEVTLQIKTGTSAKNIRSLLDYDTDCAFAADGTGNCDLKSVPVNKEHLVLLSAEKEEKPLTATDLADKTLLTFPPGCAYRARLEAWLGASHIICADQITFDSLPGILAAVCAGLGVALLPKSVATRHLKDHYLFAHEVPEKYNTLPLYLFYHKEGYRTAALHALIDTVKSPA